MKHVNIPIFIPHLGCPNDCVFCNQRKITKTEKFDAESVIPQIEAVLKTTEGAQREIAFFGGSFTGIDRELMIKLLKIGNGYIKRGDVKSLRCSTRPDYINGEILDTLSFYGMKTVELGIQSTCDEVLKICKRGHTKEQSISAMKAVRAHGFELIGQMMTSLPRSTVNDEIKTAEDICVCGADGARIYPTVVFKDTALAKMAESGLYSPSEREDIINRCAEVKRVFIKNGVPVIRLGLQAQDNIEGEISSGIYDPSVGLAVDSQIYLEKTEELLLPYRDVLKNSFVTLYVARGQTSSAVGISGTNRKKLTDKYGIYKIKVLEDEKLASYEVKIKVVPDTRR